MFESMKKKVDISVGNDIETVIGRSTVITGQIAGGGNIRVDGRVDGGIWSAVTRSSARAAASRVTSRPAASLWRGASLATLILKGILASTLRGSW